MGYVLASLIDGALIFCGRKLTGRWGWFGFALILGALLAIWLVLMATR